MAVTMIAPEVDTTWRRQAECRSVDPDLFFPVGTTGLALDHIAAAKAVCAGCRVRQPCLEFALETAQDAGVWGGLAEEERREVRRQRRSRLTA